MLGADHPEVAEEKDCSLEKHAGHIDINKNFDGLSVIFCILSFYHCFYSIKNTCLKEDLNIVIGIFVSFFMLSYSLLCLKSSFSFSPPPPQKEKRTKFGTVHIFMISFRYSSDDHLSCKSYIKKF